MLGEIGSQKLTLVTAGVYWCLVVSWGLILVFYWREHRRLKALSPIIATMVAVIFIDGARTLVESLYFGTWYTARTGLIPTYLHEMLAQPQFVLVPKVINLAAALMVIGVMARRWFSDLATEIEHYQKIESLYAELEQAHQELKKAEAARDSLIHFLLHDMRVPLTSVITGLRTIQQWEAPEGLTAEMTDVALAGSERVLGLVNDMLDVGRMQSGEMPLNRQVFAMAEAADHCLELLGPLLQEKQIRVERHFSTNGKGEPCPVFADRQKSERVLTNLLANAIKFTPTEGRVDVRLIPAGEQFLRIEVCDSGPGIAPDEQERVFDRFYQTQAGTKSPVHGSGLGLAFCKLAVELQGGRIGVESVPGEGSCFWFTLPTAPAEEPHHPDAEEARMQAAIQH